MRTTHVVYGGGDLPGKVFTTVFGPTPGRKCLERRRDRVPFRERDDEKIPKTRGETGRIWLEKQLQFPKCFSFCTKVDIRKR